MKTKANPVNQNIAPQQVAPWVYIVNASGLMRLAIIGLVALVALMAAASTPAASLIWDPANTTNGAAIDPGSGSWDLDATTNFNWNNGTTNVSWTQLSTTTGTNNAIFNGADGTNYIVNLDQGGTMNVSNLFINSSGYTFTGAGLYLQNNGVIQVADGKSVTFSNNFTAQNNTKSWFVGNGSTFYEYGSEGAEQLKYLTPATGPGGTFVIAGTNGAGIHLVLATVIVTNGGVMNNGASGFFVAWATSVALNGGPATNYTSGHLIVDGGSVVASAGGIRGSRLANTHGVITIRNGVLGLTNASPGQSAAIVGAFSGGTNQVAAFEVFGGQLNVGSQAQPYDPLVFFGTAPPSYSKAVLYQTNGIIRAAGGILFGASSGPAPTGTSAMLTNSGGFLYVGPNGIALSTFNPNTNIISLSGGTVGTLANWASSMPMTLDGNAGNITFQCADELANPFNISLSGALTGPGGLYKTGSGKLTLSGTNNYAGTTVISNGVLSIVTAPTIKTNGAVTLDGSAGTPQVTVNVSNPGQKWQMGSLTFNSGSPQIDFEYSSSPSASAAPVQVGGDLNFAVAPTVIVNGNSIAIGTYPLITYTGTLSGTMPASFNTTGCFAGYLTNVVASKTVALIVTSSCYNPAISWAVGSGNWDIGVTANWKSNTVASTYGEGDAVVFDDSATGPSPITVTLNTTVNPGGISALNTTNSYIIGGSGGIAGATGIVLQGGGALALGTANSYTGGTTVNAGSQLTINNPSAIGTGTLTLNSGSVLDNTTSSNITLQTAIPEVWSGGNPAFTYLGSGNSLNLGSGGGITMNANSTLVVASNTLAIGGSIFDGGNGLKLSKSGPGTLALLAGNNFSGGFTLTAGQVSLGDGNALGNGIFNISDGTVVDNVSGRDITLGSSQLIINGTGNSRVTFPGTSGSIDFGSATVGQNGNAASYNFNVVSNTVTFESDLITGNVLLLKTGQGILNINGFATSANTMSMTVNQGEADLGRLVGIAVSALTVQSNALVRITGSSGNQINNASPVTLNTGGTLDMNGNTEQINTLTDNNGVLQNSASGTFGILNVATNFGAVTIDVLAMTGTNCVFDVPPADAFLTANAILTGSGSLVKTGLGALTLPNDNLYNGNTTIMGGTLALAGSISNSAVISVHTNTTLDVTGRGDQTLTLNSSQTLKGNGSVNGILVAVLGSTVAPGPSSSVGTLNVANNVTLGGNLLINLNTNSTPTSSQLVTVSGTITYGGTLTVTNVGPGLAVGTVFQIFPAAVTAFSGINLVANDANGLVYTWNNNIAVDGTIQVASVTTAVNPLPGTIQVGVSGNQLSLAWPTNAGWILQSQTNSFSNGLGTNWVAIPGSTSVTSTNIIIDQNNGSVFYRLVHP